MRDLHNLIEQFGGVRPLSRALGHKHPTTVQSWKEAGHVPVWRIPEIKSAAKSAGIDISNFNIQAGA